MKMDSKVWRGVRYAIIPSLILWGLIIWALPISFLTLGVIDDCEHGTVVSESKDHVAICWDGEIVTYDKPEVIYD